MAKKRGSRPKKKKFTQDVTEAIAHIHATYNNTIITITDLNGNALCWASGGTVGFKGTRKGTPYAAQLVARNVAKRSLDIGVRRIRVYVKGPGSGRETAIRALEAEGLKIVEIRDKTPIPHDGCRPPKRRRV
ncbi:MAG: 30S ribosomal protein S11 [Caldiserica bacterium]|nr:MAG: 30S ribosomal protein S11 [Caldisericota bacterium]